MIIFPLLKCCDDFLSFHLKLFFCGSLILAVSVHFIVLNNVSFQTCFILKHLQYFRWWVWMESSIVVIKWCISSQTLSLKQMPPIRGRKGQGGQCVILDCMPAFWKQMRKNFPVTEHIISSWYSFIQINWLSLECSAIMLLANYGIKHK